MQSTVTENSSVGVSPSVWGVKPWGGCYGADGKAASTPWKNVKLGADEKAAITPLKNVKPGEMTMEPMKRLPSHHGRMLNQGR